MTFRQFLLSTVSWPVMANAAVWGRYGLSLMRPVLPQAPLPEDAIVFPTRDDLTV